MALGFAFLRPQGLKASPGKDGFRASELVGDFLDALLKDPQGSAALGAAIVEEAKELFPRFLAERQEPLRKAEGKLRALFKPFAGVLDGFLKGMKGSSIPDTLPAAVQAIKGLIALIRAESATRMLRELFHLAQTDLEINPGAVEALFRAWVDGAVRRLQTAVLAGDLSEPALARYEWGVHLKSLELLILEELDWPSVDPETLVEALKDLYLRTGFEKVLDKIIKVLDSAGDLTGPLAKILDKIIPPPAATGGSVGAAGDLPPVAEGAPICLYASWVLQENVHFKVEADTETITPITWITYAKVKPHAMEQLTYHVTWISDLGGMILHLISQERGDRASNLLNMAWDATDLVVTLSGNRIRNWAQWLFTFLINGIGCWEGTRCGEKDAMYPLTLIMADYGESILYRRWRWLIRESLLSFVTLLNHDPKARKKWKAAGEPARVEYDRGSEHESWAVAFNNDQFQGFSYLFGEMGLLILPAFLSKYDKDNYGFTDGGMPASLWGKAFGGWAFSLIGHYCSLFLCELAAGEYPDDMDAVVLLPLRERYVELPDDSTWAGILRGVHGVAVGFVFEAFVMHLMYRYLWSNNNTADGTYSGVDRQDLKLPGYPADATTSPYLLPWAAEGDMQCVQNAMGIWSHFPKNMQAYAIDWSHDEGTEVLCSRGGVITRLKQAAANHGTNSANSIEVMSIKFHPPATAIAAGIMPGVESPTQVFFDNGLSIPAKTLFPPFWDINKKIFQTLPNNLALHPSAAIYPASATIPPEALAADTKFQFLDPDHDRALAGKEYPAAAKFADGTTPIPAGVVFAPDIPSPPPTWAPMYRKGTTFAPFRKNLTMIPFELPIGTPAALPTPPKPGVPSSAMPAFLDGVAIPADVDLPPDCGVSQVWLPKPHPVTPMYVKGTLFKKVLGTEYFNLGTEYVASTMPFPDPIPAIEPDVHPDADLNYQWCVPVIAVFTDYAHGLAGFSSVPKHTFVEAVPAIPATPTAPEVEEVPASVVPFTSGKRVEIPSQPGHPVIEVFGTADVDQIRGMRVAQGRVIMLSGDTGTSAYNHLHQHVSTHSGGSSTNEARKIPKGNFGFSYTIPFLYADLKHTADNGFFKAGWKDGIPHAMTTYVSKNERTGP